MTALRQRMINDMTVRGLAENTKLSYLRSVSPVTAIGDILGHADPSTTTVYARATGQEARALVARLWTDETDPHS